MKVRVRELAEQKGLKLSKLARLADMDNNTVRRLWNNPEAPVDSVTIAKLAKALEVSVKELVED